MKHLLTEEQQEMFLRRTMAVYSEFKKDFPMETGAYKSAMSDFCDNLIFVSSELTYDVSHLRNDIEEALEVQDECDEIDSESDNPNGQDPDGTTDLGLEPLEEEWNDYELIEETDYLEEDDE
jgi:hypothetical protein